MRFHFSYLARENRELEKINGRFDLARLIE